MVIYKIMFIALTYQLMINITKPMVSLYATKMGASTAEVGMIAAIYGFFPLFFAIKAGQISDRIGNRIPLVGSTLALTISLGFPYFFPSMWALYVSQAMVGITQIFIQVSLQNMIGASTTPEQRDHHFSLFSMSVSAAALVGPIFGGYLAEHFSFQLAYLVAMIVGMFPFIATMIYPYKDKLQQKKDQGSPKLIQTLNLLKIPDLRSALFSSALVLYSRDIFIAYYPLYAVSIGYSTSTVGWIISIQALAALGVRTLLPIMTNRWGRDRVLLVSLISAGVAFSFIPVFDQLYLHYLIAALLGAGLGCGQPLSMTTTYNAAPEERKGESLGLRLATNRLSQVIAPLAFGAIGTVAGLNPLFYISGLFLLAGSYITWGSDRKGENHEKANDDRKNHLTESR